MTTTWGGSIIIAITSSSDSRRPRKRNLASAYATGTEESTVSSVPSPAYSRVLRHQVRKPGGVPHLRVVAPLPGVRAQIAGQRLLVAHHGREEEEDEGEDEEQGGGDPEGVHADPPEHGPAALGPVVRARTGRGPAALGLLVPHGLVFEGHFSHLLRSVRHGGASGAR
ncbi:hypothetical protein GCM10020254_54750 [Streptomyces goshikiensis]